MKAALLVSSLVLLALACRIEAQPEAQVEDPLLASQAFEIFQKRCGSCHGDTGSARSYMLLDRAAMVRAGKIVPGRSDESLLFQRVTGTVGPIMPVGGAKLSDNDIALIKRWIDEGAP